MRFINRSTNKKLILIDGNTQNCAVSNIAMEPRDVRDKSLWDGIFIDRRIERHPKPFHELAFGLVSLESTGSPVEHGSFVI
jgi:hypothetical protein